MTKLSKLLVALGAVGALMLGAATTSNAAVGTSTINYGPYTIPAGNGDPHGHHDGMGMIANQLSMNIQRPCAGAACTLTGMKASLVYADGSVVNWNTNAMLHHMVLMTSGTGHQDATCPGGYGGVAGSGSLERIFASGNERTPVDFTGSNYGVKLGASDQLHLVADLMNISTSPQTVYVQVEYKYATAADNSARTGVRPIWLDVDGCGDSEFNAPFGLSDTTNNIPSPVTGALVGAAGHLHDHSLNLQVENTTRDTDLCVSLPGFGETPAYIDVSGRRRISSMSTCYATATAPVGYLTQGDNIRMHARYYAGPEHSHATQGAMGIMIGYVDTTVAPPPAAPAPAVSITSPADNSEGSSQAVNVAFTASNSPTSTTCKIDRGTPAPCTSPVSYTGLSEAAHTVQVSATNTSGTRSKTVSFSIDKSAPAITISEPTEGQVVTTSNATVHLLISDAHPYTASCSLDGAAPTDCTPVDGHGHVELTGLSNGPHSFAVSATDSMGFSSTLVRNFTVEAAAPAPAPTVNITAPADNALVGTTSATVSFATTDATSTTCKLDAAPAAACSGSVAYSGLGQGSHTVTVTATNATGSATDAVTFTVDTVAPTVTITSPTNNQTIRSSTVTVNFTVTDTTATTKECRLDSGAFSACTSPKTYTGVAVGNHTVTVRATDALGRVTSVSRAFRRR